MAAKLHEIVIADDPEAWRQIGFHVEGDCLRVGPVLVRFIEDAGHSGIQSLGLSDLIEGDFDGLDLQRIASQEDVAGDQHPNGVEMLDHVVAFSWRFERTVELLEAGGLELRRIREEPTPAGAPRQAFFTLGPAVLEVVQALEGDEQLARFWGLAFATSDLDRLVDQLDRVISDKRPAVQPGRQIAPLKREAGLSLPVAFMTPRR